MRIIMCVNVRAYTCVHVHAYVGARSGGRYDIVIMMQNMSCMYVTVKNSPPNSCWSHIPVHFCIGSRQTKMDKACWINTIRIFSWVFAWRLSVNSPYCRPLFTNSPPNYCMSKKPCRLFHRKMINKNGMGCLMKGCYMLSIF